MSDDNPYTMSLGRETVNWMATDATVKRVARAICVADGRDPDWVTGPRMKSGDVAQCEVAIPEWKNYQDHARAAIAAMPEPVGHTSSNIGHG